MPDWTLFLSQRGGRYFNAKVGSVVADYFVPYITCVCVLIYVNTDVSSAYFLPAYILRILFIFIHIKIAHKLATSTSPSLSLCVVLFLFLFQCIRVLLCFFFRICV